MWQGVTGLKTVTHLKGYIAFGFNFWFCFPCPMGKKNQSEISLTSQIFILDRNEVTLRLNGDFCLSLLLLKLVSWDKNSNTLTMVSIKALKEISTTSHTVLRFFFLAKDSGGLTFVSSKVSNKISTTSHTVLRFFFLAKDSGGLTFVSYKVSNKISTTSHTVLRFFGNTLF